MIDGIGERVRRARVAAGFSQEHVALHLDLPRTAISKLEAGTRSMSAREAVALAEFLGVAVGSLLGEPEADPLAGADMRGTPSAAAREAALTAVERGRTVAQLLAVLEAKDTCPVGFPVKSNLDLPDLPVLAALMGHRAGCAERERLGFGTRGCRPLGIVLDEMGFVVMSADLPTSISGLSVPGIGPAGLIVVSRNEAPTRQRYTLARQYGALFFGGVLAPDSGHVRAVLWRLRVESFASALLLPLDIHASGIGALATLPGGASQVARVVALARAHGVSGTFIVQRAVSAGVLDEANGTRLRQLLQDHGRQVADLLSAGPQTVFDELDASLVRIRRLALVHLEQPGSVPESFRGLLESVAPGFLERAQARIEEMSRLTGSHA